MLAQATEVATEVAHKCPEAMGWPGAFALVGSLFAIAFIFWALSR